MINNFYVFSSVSSATNIFSNRCETGKKTLSLIEESLSVNNIVFKCMNNTHQRTKYFLFIYKLF